MSNSRGHVVLPEPATIGVISDTHGLLRPEAIHALHGSQHIIHAGDVGEPEILDRLNEIAPVTAVRGNVDRGVWANKLPLTEVLEVGSVSIYVLHILDDLDVNPKAAGLSAVVYGHSHAPEQYEREGVLYFNPGSAGPRRFKLPISLGKLMVKAGRITGKLVDNSHKNGGGAPNGSARLYVWEQTRLPTFISTDPHTALRADRRRSHCGRPRLLAISNRILSVDVLIHRVDAVSACEWLA